jgi:GMP synthase-like glutamine amidotransferase
MIIDPSIAWPEEEGVEAVAGNWPGPRKVLRPALEAGSGPRPGDGYDAFAVVVMGSRASVGNDLPWLRDLRAWLAPIVSGSVPRPLLGICFGHQLIAEVAGADVRKVHRDGREERGVQESRFLDCRLVPGGGTVRVIASHGEEAKSVPAGFRGVAQRGAVTVDALEHLRLPVFGVQFHPEAGASFLRKREIPEDPRESRAFEEQARLLSRFREIALEGRTGTGR